MQRKFFATMLPVAAAVLALCIAQTWPAKKLQAQAATTAANAAPAPEQPIPFSHKLHAGTNQISCETCHTMTRSGENLALPQAAFCMQCHAAIATDKPAIKKLASYASSGDPIPWVRVYQLPSFVTFSHRTHLDNKVTCQECHGPVQEREQIAHEMDTGMAHCVACHQAKKAATSCDTCHALMN